jgi:hypothetical protein
VTLHGHARVSTVDQDPGIQEAALRAAGCRMVRAEKRSGAAREGRDEPRLRSTSCAPATRSWSPGSTGSPARSRSS